MIQTDVVKPIGLKVDNLPVEQPKDSVRFALNASLEGEEGNMNYQSELGNTVADRLPDGYIAIGSINLEDGESVIFSTDGSSSEIGLFKDDVYSSLINAPCLGFRTCSPITGQYRILSGCERNIYFCDGHNTDKAINLDRLGNYRTGDQWDCNKMELSPNYQLPYIEGLEVNNSGGSIPIGSYSFAVELLDNSFNSIAIGPATDFIPIYSDPSSLTYEEIAGSLPSIFPQSEGGSLEANKSITLKLTNLDEAFDYARIIVIAKVSGRGLAEEAYESLDYIPISQGSLEAQFTGLSNFVRTDVDRVRVRPIKYNSSEAMAQIDGRLVRANLTEKQRDYSAYQRQVNQIGVKWRGEGYLPYDIETGSKSADRYFLGHTFIGDEVYALGIVFVHDDGSLSPVFHIPGRAPEPFDLVGLTVGQSAVPQHEAAHLGKEAGDTVRKWEIDNTADDLGRTAYYEGNSRYPETRDCQGNLIWGDLAGQRVRHHKMPDRRRLPIQNTIGGETRLNRIGVQFENIQYPDSSIVNHFFVSGIRRESDRTVLDTALLSSPYRIGTFPNRGDYPSLSQNYVFGSHLLEEGINTSIRELDSKTLAAISPKIALSSLPSASYIKALYSLEVTDNDNSQASQSDVNAIANRFIYGNSPQPITAQHRSLERIRQISPNSILNGGFDRPIANKSYSTPISAIEINENLFIDQPELSRRTSALVSIKASNRPFDNINLINYRPITRALSLSDSQSSFNGGGFITEADFFNIFTIGAVSRGFFGNQEEWDSEAETFSNLWIETDINFSLRASGTDCNARWLNRGPLIDYTLSRMLSFDGTSIERRAFPCREYYGYNRDYDQANGGPQLFPIPFNFDWCSECSDKFPNRLAWSPKSFSGERADGYKINLVNDYVEVGEDTGPIKAIHYDKNTLLVLTTDSAHALAPNPRVMNTDQDSVYIGTGDFLSIPPSQFAKTPYGFGGCQGRLAHVNTEYGFVWCDQKAGRVFYFNGQLVELSAKQFGLQGWFRRNLPRKLEGFCTDSTMAGAGVQLCYDPRFKRLFIHKTDFVPIRGRLPIFNDPRQFENRCFTLSYSFEYQAFISFHSWQPSYMFSTRDSFYSFAFGNLCWKHDIGIPGNYYNYKFPFIVEYVAMHPRENDLEVIQYHATTVAPTSGRELDFPTFNRFLAYSEDQSTGYQQLSPKEDYTLPWSNERKEVARPIKAYHVSKARDLAGDGEVMSGDWADTQSEYQGIQGYIDRVPTNIDYNRNQWRLSPLRNRYHIIRLIHDDDYKIIFNLSATINRVQSL
jgi:hypothetical protein